MRKKPDSTVAGLIYREAIEQADNLGEITMLSSLEIFKTQLNPNPYCEGSHRTRSMYGGYGSISYREYYYGEFSFTLTFNSDSECIPLDACLHREGSDKAKIRISLTKELWSETNLITELNKAYNVLSLDFETAINSCDYTALFSLDGITTEHKDWIINRISLLRERNFNRTDSITNNIAMREKLREQEEALMREHAFLLSAHRKEAVALENELRKTY